MKIRRSSITLVIDGDLAKATTIYASDPAMTISPLVDSTEMSVHYAIPASSALTVGTHTVTAYAENTLNLNDNSKMEFTVGSSTVLPMISWTDGALGFAIPKNGVFSGTNAPETALWFHTSGVRLQFDSALAPLKDFTIYSDATMGTTAYAKVFVPGTKTAVIGDALTGFADKTGYYAVLTDGLGNATTMYFHLDKSGPVIESTATARIDAAGTGFVFDVRGIASGGVSGIDGEVALLTGPQGPDPAYTGPSYPPGPSTSALTFTGLAETKKLMAFDRSGWIGTYDLLIYTATDTLSVSNTASIPGGGGDSNPAAGASGVMLRNASLSATGRFLPELPLGVALLNQPAGMKLELRAESEDLPAELMPNLPVEYGFPPVTSRTLLSLSGAGYLSETFNTPMRRLMRLNLVVTGSTNAVRYTYWLDTDDDGVVDKPCLVDTNGDGIDDKLCEAEFSTGTFTLEGAGTAGVAYSSIYALRHFYQWLPPGPNQSVQAGNVNVLIQNVTVGGNISVETARRTLKQPGYKMDQSDTVYEIKTTAVSTGPIHLSIGGLCAFNYSVRQTTSPLILHCSAGGETCSRVDTRYADCTAMATVYTLSPFAVMVPLDDVTAPQTELSMIGDSAVVDGRLWITTDTYIDMTAGDRATIGDISGVATSYYLHNAEPTRECLATPYNSKAAYGSCANPVYNDAFTLNEGTHTINYLSVDNWGNWEQAKTKPVFVDGTSPTTALAAKETEFHDGETVYITDADSITITAVDHVSGGVASGVKDRLFIINKSFEDCQAEPDFTGRPGTCHNPRYAEPFSLPIGTYTISYSAVDNVGNRAKVKTANIIVRDRPRIQFYPAAKSAGSILWHWELFAGATGYQVFSSTGGALSEPLAGTSTSYLQSNLMPNTAYANRLLAYTSDGVYESDLSTAATLAVKPLAPENFVTGQNASIVMGQPDFVSNLGGGFNDLYRFGMPFSAAIDKWGNLWIIDYANARVLRFNPPFTNGMGASVVLGRTEWGGTPPAVESRLRSPMGVSASRDGSLWVTGGHRVLQFKPPFYTGMPASLVIGQPDFTAWEYTTAINRLRDPYNSSVDANGSLWVADTHNNRVVRFDPPFTNGMDASLVLGQSDFYNGGSCYGVMAPSPDRFCAPSAVTEDEDGNIWVSDSNNGRVLKFKPPFMINMSASLVIGQKDFYSNCYSMGNCAISANVMNRTFGSVFDTSGNLYVTDSSANRLLKFKPPFTNSMEASVVLGQVDFTSSAPGLAANKLWSPEGTATSASIVIDPVGRLWVTDSGNRRVLGFNPAGPGAVAAIDGNSLNVSWLPGENPPGTQYAVELSTSGDFNGAVFAGYGADMLSHIFTGLSPNTVYYAKVKAVNSEGRGTDYAGLGAGRTKPLPAGGLKGVAQSQTSVLWTWGAADKNLTVEVFTSTGGSLSGALPAGTTHYLQTGLSPSIQYGVFVRTNNRSGFTDSGVVYQTTLPNPPARVEAFVSAQPADLVLGQEGFGTYSYGTSQNQLKSPTGAAFDNGGNLWVADSNNNRILKFSPPFISGMNADFVIGQNDFNSGGPGTGADKFNMPAGVAFDSAGNLWIADQYNNRVLRFSPPFSAGMGADLVIGQSNFMSVSYGTSQNTLFYPQGIAFDAEGGLWVSDYANSRVLKFSLPFSTGMNASLVLGQSEFASSNVYSPVSPQNLAFPAKIAFDKTGRLWVSDADHRRVLQFSPPFSNYMAATLVLGQADLSSNRGYAVPPAPNTMNYPISLALDSEDNVYVGDAYFYRVTKFKAPFSNDMNASLVLGQNDFFSNSGTYNPTSGSLVSPAETMINAQDESLWVVDYNRILRFTPKRAFIANISSITVTWDSNSNTASTEYLVRLSADPGGESSVASSAWQTGLNYIFQNLNSATAYFAFVKARNSAGIEGPEIGLGRAVTLAAPVYVVQSTISINGMPEAVFSASRVPDISLISSASTTGSIVIGSATSAGLILASNIYEIKPEGAYEPPAALVFYYSTSTLYEKGLLYEDVAVYEYFASSGWVWLPNQITDPINHKITVSITQIASLFGIFGIVRDRTAPVTELRMQDATYAAQDGKVYMSGKSSITLEAYDPVVYGTSTGVAFREYRIDPDTSTAFVPYDSPFGLSDGFHVVEYRSMDNAGNLEVEKSTAVYADSGAPVTESLLTGATGQNGWHVSPVTAALISTDSLSGLKGTYYKVVRGLELPPATTDYAAYSGPTELKDEGEYVLYYYADDNIGNIEAIKTTALKIDFSTPSAAYALNPLPSQTGWNNAPVTVVFAGTDAVSGIEYCSSSFTITNEGLNIPVSGYCSDYAGWSSTVSFTVNVDTTAPLMAYERVPAANDAGWNNSDVRVIFTCADTLSGVKSCPDDVLLAGGGVNISTTAKAEDYAGNSRDVSVSDINIDKTAPLSTAVLAGTYDNGWYSSSVSVILTSTDSLSEVKEILYSLDGAEYSAYQQPLTITAEGSHALRYYAWDKAGNKETGNIIEFKIDTSAPAVTYALNPAPNVYGWNNASVLVVFRDTDTLSGAVECSSQTVLVEGKAQLVAGWCRDAAGNISYSTATVNVDLTIPVVSVTQSPTANSYGWNTTPVEMIFAGSDTLSGLAYCEPAKTLSVEGASQTVSGYCTDYAGLSSTLTYIVNIDTTPPLATYSRTPANADGWNNTPVLVVFTGTDAVSGKAYCSSSFTITSEGLNIPVSGYCMDYAGLSSTATLVFNIDVTPPTIIISSPASGATYMAADIIGIDYSVSDNLSLVSSSAAWLRQTADNGAPRGALPDIIPVTAGQSLAAADIDDGVWELIASATDYAGNRSYASSGAFEIMHDTVAPVVKLDLEPGTLNLNSNGQYVTAILTTGGSNTVCFSRTGVNISAINGTALANPIYEAASHGNSDEDHSRNAPAKDKGNGKGNGRGKDENNDGHNDKDNPGHDGGEPGGDDGDSDHAGGSSVQCGTMTVKFDRGALIAVLPVNAMVKITVSGKFADGQNFSADDTIRTIKPRPTSRRDGGRFEHSKRACADAPPMALKADDELYVVSVEGDMSEREAKKESAAKARGVVRRGLAYEFGPDGAVFDKPVTISLPYDPDEKSPEKLIVAYWNEAANAWEPLASRYDAQTRVVKAEVGHFSQYQLVLAAPTPGDAGAPTSGDTSETYAPAVLGADATFRLGEVYVFPNPAKGAQVPTFHIETGIADSVNIKIYTVSGRAAHEHTLGGLPAEVDDGNGLSYAYEYAWRDHIPSGVYYYSIEARKGGQKLKKTGKFAVIR